MYFGPFKADMRKGVTVQLLAAEMLMDCGNVMVAALYFSLKHLLKLTNDGATQILNAHSICKNFRLTRNTAEEGSFYQRTKYSIIIVILFVQ
jgi:hypothetical protein